MTRKQKLELTWVGKDERPRLEPRILLEDPSLSYHAARRVSANDRFDNMLIQGDNLLALKALEQEFTGKVKCIYIDPPYNTGSAFEHYDDGIEHSLWLSLMRERLEILWKLLTPENGTILISVNDDEAHYLKVLCDEIFGRGRFVANLVWNYEGNTDNQAKIIRYHEYVLVYSRTGDIDDPRTIDPSISASSKLRNAEIRNTVVKNGPKNPPKPISLPAGFPASFASGVIRRKDVEWPRYDSDLVVRDHCLASTVVGTSGWSSREILEEFISGGCQPVQDSKGQRTVFELRPTGAIEAVKVRKQEKGHFISVLRGFGTTNQMRILLEKLGLEFTYPKPVGLIAYLITAFSGEHDLILDSFAGSGTTGHAVLKINRETGSRRRFILVELSERTILDVTIPRLKAVLDGDHRGELHAHGGGFRFYRVAPSLMQKDEWGNWVINKSYRPEQLAEALCKLEGFHYEPSQEVFWQQGRSTERDFVYVTTQTLNATQLSWFSEQVGTDRSLLILCNAWLGSSATWPNLTLKKIPNAVLGRCEFGRDDYSLQIAALPAASDPAPSRFNDWSPETVKITLPEPPEESAAAGSSPPRRRRGRGAAADPAQESLLPESDAE